MYPQQLLFPQQLNHYSDSGDQKYQVFFQPVSDNLCYVCIDGFQFKLTMAHPGHCHLNTGFYNGEIYSFQKV